MKNSYNKNFKTQRPYNKNFQDQSPYNRNRNFQNRRNNSTNIKPVPTPVDLLALARAAKIENEQWVKDLIEGTIELEDPEVFQDVAELLCRYVAEEMLNPDAFGPPVKPQDAYGEIELGFVRNRDCEPIRFGLRLDEMVRNTLLIGLTGAGKTTAVIRILRGLLSTPAKMLIFDIKGDYVHLPQLFPEAEIWKFKLPGPDYRWNPLEPMLRNWKRHVDSLTPSLANSLGFYGGMTTEAFIYEMLLQLGHKYNVQGGVYPTMIDLFDFLKKKEVNQEFKRGTETYRSFERFLSRVKSMVYAFEETVDCSTGYNLGELLAHHVVFDIRDLKEDAQTFFVELFMNQVIRYRMEKKETGGIFEILAVLDEAKRLMPAYREGQQNAIANMSKTIAFSREFGVGYLVCECDPNLLAHSIKAECYARLCFNLTEGRDIAAAASSLELNREQTAEIQTLKVGQCIARLAGRIDQPFVIEVTK